MRMGKTVSSLELYLRKTGERQCEFAKRAGLTEASVSRWIKGERVPDLVNAMAVRKASGGYVTLESWVAFAKANGKY